MTRFRRWGRRLLCAALLLVLTAGGGLWWVLRTEWLREQARLRIVAAVEKATGGKAEIGRFDFDPNRLLFTVEEFVLRGKEGAEEPPMVRIERILAGVTIDSLWQRRAHLASLDVIGARVRIVTYPDGATNLPGPRLPPTGKSVYERFVDLAVRNVVVAGSYMDYDDQRVPVNLRAENLEMVLAWEGDGPRYRGAVKARPFHFHWPPFASMDYVTDLEIAMDRGGLDFTRVVLRRGNSVIEARGRLENWRSPRISVAVESQLAMADWVKPLRLPLEPKGRSALKARVTYAEGAYEIAGRIEAERLAVRQRLWQIPQIHARADFRLVKDLLTFDRLQAEALGGAFRGQGAIRDWARFQISGVTSDLSLAGIQSMEREAHPKLPWSASVSGPVELKGSLREDNLVVTAAVALTPGPGEHPLEGVIRTRYEQAHQAISFENSFLQTAATRIEFHGAMGQRIRVRAESRDWRDVAPVVALAGGRMPDPLPVTLAAGGRSLFEGEIASPLAYPRLEGSFLLERILVRGHAVDEASGRLELDAGHASLSRLLLKASGGTITGRFQVPLAAWKLPEDAPVEARFEIRQAPLEALLAAAGRDSLGLRGVITSPVALAGTPAALRIEADPVWTGAVIGGEAFRSIRGHVQVEPGRITIREGLAEHAAGRLEVEAVYAHPPESFETGRLQLQARAAGARLAGIAAVREAMPELNGLLDLRLNAEAKLAPQSAPALEQIEARLDVRQASLRGQPLGAVELAVVTAEDRVRMSAKGSLLQSPIEGRGEWRLEGDAPGAGTFELGALTLSRLNEVLRPAGLLDRDLPLQGRFETQVVLTGSLRKPESFLARINLSRVALYPRTESAQLPAPLEELTLRNSGPVAALLDRNGIQLTQARLTGKDTNLEASGTISVSGRNAWNLSLRGGLNLAIAQDLAPGLRTTGTAVLNATVRGTLAKPVLGGRMEIQNATLAHRDLPNTIDKANGLVLFDRNRALLQNLTAQTGGGELRLNGFVTFGGDSQLTYRLNGELQRVRIRYPEGASTTVNANLSLTGTADQSLVSGLVTILRSGFTPRTDVGNVLFEAKRAQAPVTSPLLRGMQFDIRVVNAPSLQLETSLTQGLEAEVDLRLRGSPSKPVLLGTVSVTQGELNFFGTSYTITRGTVSFFNAARVEPVLDLDLETVVRAVTVNMNVSGSVDKPNITYRSDPPLQSQEIVALLAVGRTPAGSTLAPQSNLGTAYSGLFAGGDTLLGQALSAGVGGRLQRFFGVSRVKIDPQLTGLETTPQARLTIEQQISRDITLTYVTNLTGTLQQLVRLQWDFKKNWSVSVVRDENGVVGSDVLFRKRFK